MNFVLLHSDYLICSIGCGSESRDNSERFAEFTLPCHLDSDAVSDASLQAMPKECPHRLVHLRLTYQTRDSSGEVKDGQSESIIITTGGILRDAPEKEHTSIRRKGPPPQQSRGHSTPTYICGESL